MSCFEQPISSNYEAKYVNDDMIMIQSSSFAESDQLISCSKSIFAVATSIFKNMIKMSIGNFIEIVQLV